MKWVNVSVKIVYKGLFANKFLSRLKQFMKQPKKTGKQHGVRAK